jgi:hypothetical protein
MVFAAVCERHQFETEMLPKAVENGWPISINWDVLKDRVLGMRSDLEDIIADTGSVIVYNDEGHRNSELQHNEQSNTGPRMHCIFWKELLEQLKSGGS